MGADAADALARSAGILTYHHDPGELSAAFVWEPLVRGLLSGPPTARYPIGGWIADRRVACSGHAHGLGVAVESGARVDSVPAGIVILATELADARRLLGDESLAWLSGNAVCMDLAVTHRRGDPFVVVDLQETGWAERYTAADKSLAPEGEELIQAQMPIRPGESADSRRGAARAAARRVIRRLARARDVAPAPGHGRTHRRAWTRPARPGATARRSTAATACSSPATWSPLRAACRRSPGPARSRRAAWRSRAPAATQHRPRRRRLPKRPKVL